MKRHQLLTTVAATLLLTAGAASAQLNMKKDEAPAHAPAAQQNAPAEKIAPTLKSERKTPETTGQASPKEPETSETNKPMGKDTPMDKSAEPHAQSDVKAKSSTSKNEPAGTAPSRESTTAQQRATTGQGAAAGTAKLSVQQRSKITSIVRRHKVAPVHLNVSVRVGTRVPASVHVYPLPVDVVGVYPEWRGYDYILVGDEIVVIDPRTHEIVAILDA